MKQSKLKKGFTLIELIVVIAILGILMLILVPSFIGYANDAKTQVLRANARTVWTAANATVAKSEYEEDLVVQNYKVECTSVGYDIPFKVEVESKLGNSFACKTGLMFVGKSKEIDYILYSDGTKECQYYGGEDFGSDCKY